MNQLEFESLMMAHDNLQRELADIKQHLGKDKHELIKANIALNKRVQELEELLTQIKYDKEAHIALSEKYLKKQLQNKRYREAIEKIKLNVKICGNEEYFPKVVEEIVNEALEGEE